jgi:hypothetical protein
MPRCRKCASPIEQTSKVCPACGVVQQVVTDVAAPPELDARNGTPPGGRRGQVTALPLAQPAAPRGRSPVFGRHNAAFALQPPQASIEHGPAAPVRRPIEQHPYGVAARVLPLRADPIGAPTASDAFPRQADSDQSGSDALVEHSAIRPAEPLGRLTPSAQSAARPPVLASEALRRELAPAAPAHRQARALAAFVGVFGFAVTWLVCGPHGLGIPLGGAFLALCVLGLAPMAYQARAAALVTLSGSALTVVTWHRLEHAPGLEPLVLMIAVTVLAMALFFRSWHRASLLARALVVLGASLCAGWLWVSRVFPQLLVLGSAWQAWLPPLLTVPLAVLLLLSLLAFMDSRSTGSCSAWAGLLLGWYTLYTWSDLLRMYMPIDAPGFDFERVPAEVAVALLAGPLLATVLASGLAQLLAVATATDTEA